MDAVDVLSLSDILLAIAVFAIIGQGMVNVMIAVACFYSAVLRYESYEARRFPVKQAPYVEVAPFPGMFKHKNPVCTYFPWYDPVYDR